jgi:hypothetical protein
VSSLRFNNPTGLGVGHEGVIFGQQASVIGRSVLKSGDGYRWDEYHLRLADRTETTLVYESGVWKRFALFDPDITLSADDAADLGVGEQVTLRGRSANITYVGNSRVMYIEGKAPEGYRVGSEARYFNAEEGSQLFVVSWTGNEVEFYEGQDLPRGDVERAFGLPEPSLLARIFSGGSGGLDSWFEGDHRLFGTVLVAFAVLVILWAQGRPRDPAVEPPPPTPAPALHLPARAQGRLAGHLYVIAGHEVAEISESRGTFARHEYELVDEQGERALLIQRLDWDARQWYLFRPVSSSVGLIPYQAAAFKHGSLFNVGDKQAAVRTLFMSRMVSRDGDVPSGALPGAVRYGFTAQTKDEWVIGRWNESSIEFQAGDMLPEADIQQAFGRGVSN